MWLFTILGFYSVSAFGKHFNVRARDKKHLLALMERFPQLRTDILTTPDRDYRFRIEVARKVWVKAVAEMAAEQDWSNFKDAVARLQHGRDPDYLHALHQIWGAMHELQSKNEESMPEKWEDDPELHDDSPEDIEEMYDIYKSLGSKPEDIKDEQLSKGYEAWLKKQKLAEMSANVPYWPGSLESAVPDETGQGQHHQTARR